jgi:phosphoadenosine phosphosulfate reductase
MLEKILEKISGPIAAAFSYQAEDAAVLGLLAELAPNLRDRIETFTLDTGKFFPETEEYHGQVQDFFGLTIRKYQAGAADLRELEQTLGEETAVRKSLENRRLCCKVRKVIPLSGALRGKSAWITGLRSAQSVTRANLQPLEWDETNGLIKINPLADWSDSDLEAYLNERKIPVHPLYRRGFKSIGCRPCTRAVEPGEDLRAGRWWWENPDCKECGLHRARQREAGKLKRDPGVLRVL